MVGIVQAVEDLDPGWLRSVVRPADLATFSGLTSVSAERLAEGVGIATDIYRLHLSYAPGAAMGPATLVMKLPSSNPDVRVIAEGAGIYQREVLFYREIAPTVALRMPKAYVAEFYPQTRGFVLVMEDLASAVDGDQVAGLPLEHARLALNGIAALHAKWWDRPELRALEATIPPFGEGPWRGTGARLAAAWPVFERFLDGRASPALRRIGARMAAAIEPMMDGLAQAPRTLCHGDFRADNLMFASQDDGRPTLIILDWQWALQARGAVDVGYLLSMSVTTALRRAHEDDLLRGYHDSLLTDGVADYPYEMLRHDYFRGVLVGFFQVIQAGAAIDLTQPRSESLFDCAVRRLDATVLDHGLEAFLA
ncbi:phosphotransferase [Phenylobacterium sp.]|uniref:phosphotransferase n=1 Tax=Phenylobacterium sp. TaxID=1871053 RepID=UPI002F420661